MRKSEREITDRAAIDDVIRRAKVCRLGLCDDGQPYVVPVCFGYDGKAFYCHSATEGRKLDVIRKNSHACVEIDIDQELKTGDKACACGMSYRSVIAFGTASIVAEAGARRQALDVLMQHYTDGPFSYSEEALGKTSVIRIDIESITGKQSGY